MVLGCKIIYKPGLKFTRAQCLKEYVYMYIYDQYVDSSFERSSVQLRSNDQSAQTTARVVSVAYIYIHTHTHTHTHTHIYSVFIYYIYTIYNIYVVYIYILHTYTHTHTLVMRK